MRGFTSDTMIQVSAHPCHLIMPVSEDNERIGIKEQ